MPELGEVKQGKEIGKNSQLAHYVWHACVDCGKQRWVQVRYGGPRENRCHRCSITGHSAPGWKGGKHKQSQGYVLVYLFKDDFFYSMTHGRNYVLEHRLVMAKNLGRCLQKWEIVHHKNGIKDDNRIENLQLVTDDRHKQITILENRINYLEKRVTLLEAENIMLREGFPLRSTD